MKINKIKVGTRLWVNQKGGEHYYSTEIIIYTLLTVAEGKTVSIFGVDAKGKRYHIMVNENEGILMLFNTISITRKPKKDKKYYKEFL